MTEKSPRLTMKGYSFKKALYRNKDSIKAIRTFQECNCTISFCNQ